jgi:hypothetical protein
MVFSSKMEPWGSVDGDGGVGLSTEAPVTGQPPRERARARGSERASGRKAMTCGDAVSARERRRAGARGRSRPMLGWAVRLGQARARAHVSGPSSWAGPREKGRIGPISFLFFFFK